MKRIALALLLVLVATHVNAFGWNAPKMAQKVKAWPSAKVCSYHHAALVPERAELYIRELRRRGNYSPKDLKSISNGVIGVGMSEAAVICSWPELKEWSRSGYHFGNRITYSQPYKEGTMHVVVHDGVVESWHHLKD